MGREKCNSFNLIYNKSDLTTELGEKLEMSSSVWRSVFPMEVEDSSARKSNVIDKRKTHSLLQPSVQFHMQISLLFFLIPTSHMTLTLFTYINNLNVTFKIMCRFKQVNMETNSFASIPNSTDTKYTFPVWWLFLTFLLMWHFVYHISSQRSEKVSNVKKSLKGKSNAKELQMEPFESPAPSTSSLLPQQFLFFVMSLRTHK